MRLSAIKLRQGINVGRGALGCWLPLLLVLFLLAGCAGAPIATGPSPFRFGHDTFAYPNELVWEYAFAEDGHWSARERNPPPDYALRCFPMIESARKFFYHARFDPGLPRVEADRYRELVRKVLAYSSRELSPETKRVVIPGYADLFAFSADWEPLLKEESGGAWQSYFQRGHWRMIFPFSRAHQAETAERLVAEVRANRPPVVHLVTFPSRTINHAALVFSALETPSDLVFGLYDPNNARQPAELTFDRATRTFIFPRNNYFIGGPIDVYEIYRGIWY
jgi:hypothetical protein